MDTGKRYWKDGTPVPGQQFEYTHDNIGNRTQTQVGGDQSGAGLRPAAYTPNPLNQYESRTVPSSVDITGIANAAATTTVTVGGQATASVFRSNEFYQATGTVNNTNSPAWVPVTVSAARGGTNNAQSGNLLVPPATQSFQYDNDGNLRNDGVWSYTWDAENRLIAMDCLVSGPIAQHLTFEYDWQGRRIHKVVKDASQNTLTDLRFLYDGWNLLAVLTSDLRPLTSFLWGLDLSGTFQGAGGVGGLLAVTDAASGTHFTCYDGNGNVTGLVKASDGSTTARYEYGPFGELLRATGTMAKSNPFRFSTKYTDDETDLVYYGYRYYAASTGKWLSRDPLEEAGGLDLYAFCNNDGLNSLDLLGLEWKIIQEGKPRAKALAASSSDTFDGLARKLKLDTSDYHKWAQTTDGTPIPCKYYSVPNTIYVDKGVIGTRDKWPSSIISLWDRDMQNTEGEWKKAGYNVVRTDNAIGSIIRVHLGDADLYGYVYIGHGAPGGILGLENLDDKGDTSSSALSPDRYTQHGIAFMWLKACYSAESIISAGRHPKYARNAWESNVSTRGAFMGYDRDVNVFTELFLWFSTTGKNYDPAIIKRTR